MRPASKHALTLLWAFLSGVGGLWAQAGDHEGEPQPPFAESHPGIEVPDAPVLTPEQEAETFRLPPGYGIELVAAEPLIHDPVVALFDAAGRLWVAEMRSYMPDVDGTGEDTPNGTIAVLTDTDGDGRMDERSVFLDGLVLPRAIVPCQDGLLVISPPELFFCRDTDDDGKADERVVIETNLGGLHSPEHAINSLMLGLDNWYECANWNLRYRVIDGEWTRQRTAGGGQWGLTKDDVGRLFFNTNSDPLRGDRFPSHYAVRNGNHGSVPGTNVRVVPDLSVWPSRVNSGVNRGYQKATLKEDGRLARYTAVCAPLVYRGDALPLDGEDGDAFVCEPSGHLVSRFATRENADGVLTAANPYHQDEFLTSTDERFRPVNLFDGPDGAIYVVDMYRGIIQHRVFVTSYLRKEILSRGLEEGIGLGRIWRIVHEETNGAGGPLPAEASWEELEAELSHPNGWRRDMAQRAFVEEGEDEPDVPSILRRAATEAKSPLGRVHALWALEGLGRQDSGTVLHALADSDRRVNEAGVRVSERLLPADIRGEGRILSRLVELARTGDRPLRRQVIFSLGEAGATAADQALLEILGDEAFDSDDVHAVLSSLSERELGFLDLALGRETWAASTPDRVRLFTALARSIGRGGQSASVAGLVQRIVDRAEPARWQSDALIAGVLAARPKGADGEPLALYCTEEPPAFTQLVERSTELADSLVWPGRPGANLVAVRPLDEAELARFEAGRAIFQNSCSSCHQPSGRGAIGQAPPLRSSPWVLGPPERPIQILLHGLSGPIEVGGTTWNLHMPAQEIGDEEIAAVLTYVRREWGHGAAPVTVEQAAAERARSADRKSPWTIQELSEAR